MGLRPILERGGAEDILMNPAPFSSSGFEQENGHESDSDSNPEESPEYYQPISAVDDDDSGSSSPRVNGYMEENGDLKGSDEEDEEEERGESYEETTESALREEERRYAPLPEGSALRVMEAMRGVSFGGETPDWARAVPEDQWIQRLRSLRHH